MVDIAGQEISVLYSIKLPIKHKNTFESEVIFDVYSGEPALFGLTILNRLELVLFCSEKDTYLYFRNTPYFAYNLNVNLERQNRILLAANTECKIPLFSKQIKKKGKVLILVSQKDTEDKIFPPQLVYAINGHFTIGIQNISELDTYIGAFSYNIVEIKEFLTLYQKRTFEWIR